MEYFVVRGFFGSLTLLIAMVKITIASSDDQINGMSLSCAESEVKRVVSKVIAFEHLILKIDLVFFINVTPTANLNLSNVCHNRA